MKMQNIVAAIILLVSFSGNLHSQDCNRLIPLDLYSFESVRCYLKEKLLKYKDTTELDLKDLFLVGDCYWRCSPEELKNLDIDSLDSEAFLKLGALTSIKSPVFIPIPKQIEKLNKLKSIHQYFLSSFYFWLEAKAQPAVPDNLWGILGLESLTLYTDKIPVGIENLIELKYLNICNRSELPLSLPNKDSWNKLKNLNTIILHSAQMPRELFASLTPLQSLQQFDLTTKANIKGFIDSCFQILSNNATTLKVIRLNVNAQEPPRRNSLGYESDDGIGQSFALKNNYPILEKLLLKHCALIEFSADAAQFPKLTTLDLSFNRLRNFNLKVADSSSIKHLDLSYNFLTILPATLLQLTALESIDLQCNRILDLPLGLEHLPNLKEIKLDNRIPPTILANLQKRFGPKLKIENYGNIGDYDYWMKESFISFQLQDKTYDYRNNKLDKFHFALKNKPLIKKLWLQQNIFSKFPLRILSYKKLLELDISSNLLTNIPKQIKNLKALKTLNLSQNYIQELPESFGKLEQVQRLNLSFNLLKTLPKSIGELQELEYLGLVNNPLETLPVELKKLQKIKTIYISNDLDKALKDLLIEWFGKNRISVTCERRS